MIGDVRVNIDDRTVISACNTPGGVVYEWRDDVAVKITRAAIISSPVNDPANAYHRGGRVGTFKASWAFDRAGSNQHRVQATIYNGADHAEFVEFGRGASRKSQTFAWTQFPWPAIIRRVGYTGPRAGKHILRDATNRVMVTETGGAYSPLN